MPPAASSASPIPTPDYARALVWFRRDLRDFDHAALYHALRRSRAVHCVFVFGRDYPAPIVDHAQARAAALRLFKRA